MSDDLLSAGSVPGSIDDSSVRAFARMASDPTGTVTFERFLWQAKLAVREGLATLSPGGPIAVVCEHVEDLVIVQTSLIRFAQLKTRDKGSWTAARICGEHHAISSLVKAYLSASEAEILEISQFEVWLEGPQGDEKETTTFFDDPTKASDKIKAKIRAMGLRGRKLTDFLSRLVIHCQQPSRASIDAVVMKAIGAVWPGMAYWEVEALYEKLLQAATSAQAASEQPLTVRRAVSAARTEPENQTHWDPIRSQSLTRDQVRALCPPTNTESNEELFKRAAAGEASLLELKLVRAGARTPTLKSALDVRADAEVATVKGRASGRVDDDSLIRLESRVLSMADSLLALHAANGGVGSTAEHVFHTMMTHGQDVNATDVDRVFEGDYRLVVGHLCGVSDQCRFGWGVS
ncbi:dsDNA nuclease domain-containing protein [Leifsonia sp. NPDC058292]|uniref:dsDNA nuclease domain-containing protein n=1 Tax=Leifsonia sp. NPDC058292 TaxID=3346428 RepID=UPI0036DD744A